MPYFSKPASGTTQAPYPGRIYKLLTNIINRRKGVDTGDLAASPILCLPSQWGILILFFSSCQISPFAPDCHIVPASTFKRSQIFAFFQEETARMPRSPQEFNIAVPHLDIRPRGQWPQIIINFQKNREILLFPDGR
jgi:hypothetical protein|tara:strand:+ start:110 stop:520 length:411 start_codon:yes stop_codon:yes gene_type:complete